MAKTIVALYDDFSTAQSVLQDLIDAGFSRENISLMASDATGEHTKNYTKDPAGEDVTAGEGAGFGAVVGTLIGLGVSLIPGIGPVIGAGPLAVALTAGIGAAAGAITGGISAALIDLGVSEEDAPYYAEGLRRGGTLVSVTADDAWTDRVEEVLNRHHPIDIDHRAAYWRDTGWTGFSEEGTPYNADQVVLERESYRNYSGTAPEQRREALGTSDVTGDFSTTAERRARIYDNETR